MTKFIDLDVVIGNALIEMIEGTEKSYVSYEDIIRYGEMIVKKLHEIGTEAVFDYSRDELHKLKAVNKDFWFFTDDKGVELVVLSLHKSVSDLREQYRGFMSVDTLLAFTNIEALKTLGVLKNETNINGKVLKIVGQYGYKGKIRDEYQWRGHLYLGDSPLKKGFEGIIVDQIEKLHLSGKVQDRYMLGRIENNQLNFTVFSSVKGSRPFDYSLIRSPEDNGYYGQWNYVNFFDKSINFGGVAKVSVEEVYDEVLRDDLINKVENWENHLSLPNPNYEIMIGEMMAFGCSKLADTFVYKNAEQAKKLIKKRN